MADGGNSFFHFSVEEFFCSARVTKGQEHSAEVLADLPIEVEEVNQLDGFAVVEGPKEGAQIVGLAGAFAQDLSEASEGGPGEDDGRLAFRLGGAFVRKVLLERGEVGGSFGVGDIVNTIKGKWVHNSGCGMRG